MHQKVGAGVRKLWAHLASREKEELQVLLAALALVAAMLLLLALVGNVLEGDTQEFDERLLVSLRKPEAPAEPIGPRWLKLAAVDITALGGPAILGLTVAAVIGYLLLYGLYRNALFVLIASVGGWVLNDVLKMYFGRPRPTVVPHLREVSALSLSFPSGHALTSAVVFLTLGTLLMRVSNRPLVKWYCISLAMTATALIGSSRVYLGVHYPSDVVGGWLIGMSWAVFCWMLERAVERRYGLKEERAQAG